MDTPPREVTLDEVVGRPERVEPGLASGEVERVRSSEMGGLDFLHAVLHAPVAGAVVEVEYDGQPASVKLLSPKSFKDYCGASKGHDIGSHLDRVEKSPVRLPALPAPGSWHLVIPSPSQYARASYRVL